MNPILQSDKVALLLPNTFCISPLHLYMMFPQPRMPLISYHVFFIIVVVWGLLVFVCFLVTSWPSFKIWLRYHLLFKKIFFLYLWWKVISSCDSFMSLSISIITHVICCAFQFFSAQSVSRKRLWHFRKTSYHVDLCITSIYNTPLPEGAWQLLSIS